MQRCGLPFLEARSKLTKKPLSLQEMKEWRTQEADAGRPSSFADLCRAFGLCVTCLGEGVTRNDCLNRRLVILNEYQFQMN